MSFSPFQSRTASRAPEHVSGAGADVRAVAGSPLVALVGNPNCGKSTIFNALTGGSRAVGNWAGVTVDSGVGTFNHAGVDFDIVDLPGVYSLSASTVDEQVTSDFVAAGEATMLVNVLDASNLERNLYLTMQLVELGLPMAVVLNMGDVADSKGMSIDAGELSRQLGCPVVEVSGTRRTGLEALRAALHASIEHPARPHAATTLDPAIEVELARLTELVEETIDTRVPHRWIATRLLEFDPRVEELAGAILVAERDAAFARIEEALDEEADVLLADARYERIGQLVDACVHHRGRIGEGLTERLDRIALHPRWGIPVFLGVMYLMFVLTITVGSAFIDLFDQLGGLVFVDLPAYAMHAIGMPEGIVVLLANGLGGGMQSVATFIPPVGIMFLCLRTLEESGYMARAAFVMDRFMRGLGLPGKAFVPMIVGFGCNVPAIMGARTLERERDRKLAVALNPFMSCGARLPVYALFAAAFFPSSGQAVVFGLYLLGIAFAVMTGLILKRTLLVGELTPFVMELPPYHRPALGSVLRGAWSRLRSFLVGAGRIIVPVVAALTVLGSFGTDGSLGNEDTENSALSAVGKAITPIFAPMGVEQDNWPATVGIFTGIFAKEAVVGTLDALYSQLGSDGAPASGDEPFDPVGQAGAAFATVPPNLVDAGRNLLDPLGLSVGAINSPQAAAEEQGVNPATYGEIHDRFSGQVGAFAYLVFILLYLPCVAATAAIYRETGRNWAIFVGCWTTGLAYGAATITYQLLTFTQHPASSAGWIGVMLGAFALAVTRMRRLGGDDEPVAALARVASPTPAPAVAPAPAPMPAAAPAPQLTTASLLTDDPIPEPAATHAPPPGWAHRPVFTPTTAPLGDPTERRDPRTAPQTKRPASALVRTHVPPLVSPGTPRLDGRATPAFERRPFTTTGASDASS